VGRFIHGLFDVYWVAATTTLPWIVAGIACGTADADDADAQSTPDASRRKSRSARISRS
jgi:hypothetical protein